MSLYFLFLVCLCRNKKKERDVTQLVKTSASKTKTTGTSMRTRPATTRAGPTRTGQKRLRTGTIDKDKGEENKGAANVRTMRTTTRVGVTRMETTWTEQMRPRAGTTRTTRTSCPLGRAVRTRVRNAHKINYNVEPFKRKSVGLGCRSC